MERSTSELIGRDRRCAAGRDTCDADGLSRARVERILDRQDDQARRHHPRGQRPRAAQSDRGGLDLPPAGTTRRAEALHPQRAVAGGSGHCVEGAISPDGPISQAQPARQETDRRHRGNRARDGGVHVGHRPPHHARALSSLPDAPNGGREVGGRGISDTRFVASFALTPVVRQE